jgi:ABC-type antimicrobial peptide transport system permease subunit
MEENRSELFFTDRVLILTIAFSIVEIYLSWKAMHRTTADSRNWITIFGLFIGVFIMGSLLTRGKVLRDRALAGLFLVITTIWLFLQAVLPSSGIVWGCRLGVLGLWVTAAIVGVCFLFQEASPKRTITNHKPQITN